MQREKTLAYYQQCILAAEELQAESLCITASGACYDLDRALLMLNAVQMLKELAEFAGETWSPAAVRQCAGRGESLQRVYTGIGQPGRDSEPSSDRGFREYESLSGYSSNQPAR